MVRQISETQQVHITFVIVGLHIRVSKIYHNYKCCGSRFASSHQWKWVLDLQPSTLLENLLRYFDTPLRDSLSIYNTTNIVPSGSY